MWCFVKLIEFVENCTSQFEAAPLFYGHGTDNPYDEAVWLCCYALGLKAQDIDDSWNRVLTLSEQQYLTSLSTKRIKERKPTAYLLGRAWFAGLEFIVNEDVLIPRSPIAELILHGFEPFLSHSKSIKMLDLCCGSGCIGLAAAYYLSNARVDLLDISPPAIEVAKKNQQLQK